MIPLCWNLLFSSKKELNHGICKGESRPPALLFHQLEVFDSEVTTQNEMWAELGHANAPIAFLAAKFCISFLRTSNNTHYPES